MVLENTRINQRLVKQMTETVNQHSGYRAVVDSSWNCGKDIRFEIGTSHEMRCPFIVRSTLTDDAGFEIKIRMLCTELDSEGMLDLKDWLFTLEDLTAALKTCISRTHTIHSL